MSQTDFSVISLASIAGFDAEADVLVCGFGGAGGSAAFEAAKAGASVILYERASGAGGSTGMSSCEMYLGGSGGTSLQKTLGFEDSTENFIAYLEKANVIVNVRRSRGKDVDGGCGQLAMKRWEKVG